MNDLLRSGMAAALRIQRRVCCYAGSKLGTARFCDCKYLQEDLLGRSGSENTGCAEARAVISLLEDLDETGSYDEANLKRCRDLGRRLQKACCRAANGKRTRFNTSVSLSDTIVSTRTTFSSTHSHTGLLSDGSPLSMPDADADDQVPSPDADDAFQLQRSPRCKCTCNQLSEGGSGCFEAWIIRDVLRKISKQYPVRVSDAGVTGALTVMVNWQTVITLKMKALVVEMAASGQLPGIVAAVAQVLKQTGNPVGEKLTEQFGNQTPDLDEVLSVSPGVVNYTLPPGLTLPADMRPRFRVGEIAALVIASRDGLCRFITACTEQGGLAAQLEGINVPPQDARAVVDE